ncbi:hypothetical protein EST38_g12051 [Candolleomyces aberdarensis]|uniref:Uncharacterized protein n=1 Tax=Candolleomyces aberdarensis TaxID=2316362 RepID=A0A4Q2D3F4_9AGAR|nr:hypothetical protein EST38_g12051 [Candolleomyces aberdarensis]
MPFKPYKLDKYTYPRASRASTDRRERSVDSIHSGDAASVNLKYEDDIYRVSPRRDSRRDDPDIPIDYSPPPRHRDWPDTQDGVSGFEVGEGGTEQLGRALLLASDIRGDPPSRGVQGTPPTRLSMKDFLNKLKQTSGLSTLTKPLAPVNDAGPTAADALNRHEHAVPSTGADEVSARKTIMKRQEDVGIESSRPSVKPRRRTKRLETSPVIEIMSSSSEDLADRPMDPGDSMYRGRPTRSRIESVRETRDISPPATRRAARLARGAAGTTGPISPTTPSSTKPRTRSFLVVDASEHALDGVDPPTSTHTRKRANQANSATPDKRPRHGLKSQSKRLPSALQRGEESSDIDLPTVLDLLKDDSRFASNKSSASKFRKSAVLSSSKNRFVDDEAEEDGMDARSEVNDVSLNEYDLDDPFIDDSENCTRPNMKTKRMVSNHADEKTSTRKPDNTGSRIDKGYSSDSGHEMNIDGEYPGIEEEHPLVTAHKNRYLQRKINDKNIYETQTAYQRHVDFVNSALDSLAQCSNEQDNYPPSDDSDRQIEVARRESIRDLYSKTPTTPKNKGKGKARATSLDADVREAELVEDDGLSDYERKQLHSPSKPGTSNTSDTYLEDVTTLPRCKILPNLCQVTDPEIQDPILAGDYVSLPNLTLCELIPWTDLTGPGQVNFSSWAEQCPNMDGELAYRALSFVESNNFVNPSRASPVDTAVREIAGASPRYNLYRNRLPLIAVSPLFLEHSQISEPSPNGLRQKYIRGIYHSQEWEHFTGFTGMAFGHTQLHAQLARDALQFSTRAAFPRKTENGEAGKLLITLLTVMSLIRLSCRSTRTSAPARVNADNFSLPTDGQIPVYDGRYAENFDFNVDLANISQRLPHFPNSEIPYGSFVVAGYTMSIYRSNAGNWTLACNIQWVIVIGTPSDPPREDVTGAVKVESSKDRA